MVGRIYADVGAQLCMILGWDYFVIGVISYIAMVTLLQFTNLHGFGSSLPTHRAAL